MIVSVVSSVARGLPAAAVLPRQLRLGWFGQRRAVTILSVATSVVAANKAFQLAEVVLWSCC
jgi:hypothetical protein